MVWMKETRSLPKLHDPSCHCDDDVVSRASCSTTRGYNRCFALPRARMGPFFRAARPFCRNQLKKHISPPRRSKQDAHHSDYPSYCTVYAVSLCIIILWLSLLPILSLLASFGCLAVTVLCPWEAGNTWSSSPV